MAQIIRHRKGVLESVNGSTKRKAELLIVTGSSGITATNSSAMVFFGDGTDATAANKVLYGTSTPDLTGNDYGNSVDGIPYYNTSQNKLYILAKAGNIEVQSTANTGGTGIMSGSEQVANALNTDNRNINLGSGTLTTTGISNLGVISGSSMDLTGNANIQGNITLGGNITIGDASSDTIAFGGDLSTDIIPNANNTLDLGSSSDKFAEVHATNVYGAVTGQVNATNNIVSSSSDTSQVNISIADGVISAELYGGVVSGSSQISADQTDGWAADVKTQLNSNTVISGSAQLLNVATDFGTGRVSGEDIGDLAGTSTFTGSFVGDGSGLTGLSTDLGIADALGNSNAVDLINDTLTFNSGSGATGIEVTVGTDTVSVTGVDATTSAKGVASFDSDDFTLSSGNVSLKSGDGSLTSGGVRGANLNDDTAGDGLTYSLSNQQLDVSYGSIANTAVEGNTTATFTGTANEITVSDNSAQAIGSGIAVTIGLPDDVTIADTLTVNGNVQLGNATSDTVTIAGNLQVEGTTTTVDSTTVQIGDNILELNGTGATNAGLLVKDATAPNTVSGSLLWDSTNDYWMGGAAGSEKEFARLNAAPTSNTVQKADSNGLLVDSVLTDDGTDATFSGDLIIDGLSVGSNGGFIYVDTSNQLNSATATTAGDVIQWDGSSFVASNELDGGTF